MKRNIFLALFLAIVVLLSGCNLNTFSVDNKTVFEEGNLEALSVTMKEAETVAEDCSSALYLKRDDNLYALNIMPGGNVNEKFGLDMFSYDFMYNGGVRYYKYEHEDPPAFTFLFNDSYATFGEIPTIVLRKGDRLVRVFRTELRDMLSDPIRVSSCKPISPSFRMFYGIGVEYDRVSDYGYLLLYDFKTNETICLNSKEVQTMEVKDSQGNTYERYKVDGSIYQWNYDGLEFGKTYIVSWEGSSGKQELEVIADSWQYGKNMDSKFKEKELKLSYISDDYLIEEYEFPKMPAGTYLIKCNAAPVIINVN